MSLNNNIIKIAADLDSMSGSNAFICTPEQCSSYLNKKRCYLNVVHWNIRSIGHNFNELIVLLSRIDISCDVIILTECWLSKNLTLPVLDGFCCYCSNSNNQNDGVVLYVRKKLDCCVCNYTLSDANCLILKYKSEVALIAIYRSPQTNNIGNFMKSLNGLLPTLSQFRSLALIGDMNINIIPDPSNRIDADDYLEPLAAFGLLPAHQFPTREKTCIDHVMLRTKSDSTTLVLDISSPLDHAPIFFGTDIQTKTTKTNESITKIDRPAIINDIKNTDFSPVMKSTDPNHAAELLVATISSIIQENTQIIRLARRKRTIKPWITPGLLKCIRNRDKLHKNSKKYPENMTLHVTFTRYRNFCNNLLKRIKRAYEQNEFDKAKNNPKATWERQSL
ncbi:uncharacterized protein LOC125489786 [Plutella xylostella]|uniref:uncharacterized protein LOC125489786 n=1 Tax=Plutella xylostella TaxID=51655 RepID=UPI002032775E|nr:uncharacterized protein LOC125489786 [Plutella xylostella]